MALELDLFGPLATHPDPSKRKPSHPSWHRQSALRLRHRICHLCTKEAPLLVCCCVFACVCLFVWERGAVQNWEPLHPNQASVGQFCAAPKKPTDLEITRLYRDTCRGIHDAMLQATRRTAYIHHSHIILHEVSSDPRYLALGRTQKKGSTGLLSSCWLEAYSSL